MYRLPYLIPLFCILSAQAQSIQSGYQPFTAEDRLRWVATSTVGPRSLMVGVFSAGFGTLVDSPKEYGPHWDGFGKRYGMRLTGIATGNLMEAGIGAAWGEDPRYFRADGQSFGSRLRYAVKMTFLARNEDGGIRPAYARYIAVAGNNALSNTWRADHDATATDATVRIGIGFLGRMGGNLFSEFWPDVKRRFSRKDD